MVLTFNASAIKDVSVVLIFNASAKIESYFLKRWYTFLTEKKTCTTDKKMHLFVRSWNQQSFDQKDLAKKQDGLF